MAASESLKLELMEPEAPTWVVAVAVTAAFIFAMTLIAGFLGVVGHLW